MEFESGLHEDGQVKRLGFTGEEIIGVLGEYERRERVARLKCHMRRKGPVRWNQHAMRDAHPEPEIRRDEPVITNSVKVA